MERSLGCKQEPFQQRFSVNGQQVLSFSQCLVGIPSDLTRRSQGGIPRQGKSLPTTCTAPPVSGKRRGPSSRFLSQVRVTSALPCCLGLPRPGTFSFSMGASLPMGAGKAAVAVFTIYSREDKSSGSPVIF